MPPSNAATDFRSPLARDREGAVVLSHKGRAGRSLHRRAKPTRSAPMISLANPTRFLALVDRVVPARRAHPDFAGRRPLSVVLRGAARLPAGRDRQDHVRPRAGRLARHVRLYADRRGGPRHADLAASAGRRRRQDRRPDRRHLHVSSRWSPARCGASRCGAPIGCGTRGSPPCWCCSCSISA